MQCRVALGVVVLFAERDGAGSAEARTTPRAVLLNPCQKAPSTGDEGIGGGPGPAGRQRTSRKRGHGNGPRGQRFRRAGSYPRPVAPFVPAAAIPDKWLPDPENADGNLGVIFRQGNDSFKVSWAFGSPRYRVVSRVLDSPKGPRRSQARAPSGAVPQVGCCVEVCDPRA